MAGVKFNQNFPLGSRGWGWRVALWLLVVFLSACAAGGNRTAVNDAQDALLQQAQEAAASGAKERAQELLEQATKLNPTDKTAWLRLAQLHFERGNYPSAVLSGQEVLSRDNNNLEANSIVLVSSLRMAAKALTDLRGAKPLNGDARGEAQKVAGILRETLGETSLIPAPTGNKANAHVAGTPTPASASTAKARPQPPTKKTVVIKPSTTTPKVEVSAEKPSRSDPFGALR